MPRYYMYNTFSKVLLSLLVLPIDVAIQYQPAVCNGCYLYGMCICNDMFGIFRTLYECKKLICVKNKISILETFCKDNKGNCLKDGDKLPGIFKNHCVTFTCSITKKTIARIRVDKNLVCTMQHIYATWKEPILDEMASKELKGC
ncbi:uncharacterized protein LOC106869794 isoform X1 [Octopus bimaculoides]|uniref:uncharacterized protein LOC106869794 isoform X1 n=2 Tax=Octopus bimaculoides TaxID=37653 RepID=UPI0022DF72D6|nr:uncharacterized protein LOC106869794 isoform X1 [Octopus bimaculoides]